MNPNDYVPQSHFTPTTQVWPCDRGTGWPVGYHHFQLSPGATVAVCVFCGKAADK